jgi:hypothetical protein
MGYLEHLNSFKDYIFDLSSLNTIDFQPLRDFSLLIDILFFKLFDKNITVFHNLLIWFFSCLVFKKILFKIFPSLNPRSINLFLILFSLYPLFSTTLLWGVARKHTLSLLFILLATNELMKKNDTKISLLKCGLFYFLSILSQPINLLWPCWGILWLFKNQREKIRDYLLLITPVLITGFWLNWSYYNFSPVFKLYYHSKLENFVSIPEKIQALSHYFMQLVLPINLNFSYGLGGWQSIVGIPVGVLLFYFVWKKIKDKYFLMMWTTFGVAPLLIIINTPNLMLDCYLLIPGIAFLIIGIKTFEKIDLDENKQKWLFVCLLITFTYLNFSESKNWRSLESYTTTAFERRPTCTTAISAAIFQFDDNEKLDPELWSYLELNGCIKIYQKMTITQLDSIVRLNSQIIFYEKNFSLDVKERAIKNMTKASYVAYFYLLALHAKSDQTVKFSLELKDFITLIKMKNLDYEKIISRYVYPFCKKQNNNQCLNDLKKLATRNRRIWL